MIFDNGGKDVRTSPSESVAEESLFLSVVISLVSSCCLIWDGSIGEESIYKLFGSTVTMSLVSLSFLVQADNIGDESIHKLCI